MAIINMDDKHLNKLIPRYVRNSIKDSITFTKDLRTSITENKEQFIDMEIKTSNLYGHANHPDVIVDFIIKKYVEEFECKLKMISEHYKNVKKDSVPEDIDDD